MLTLSLHLDDATRLIVKQGQPDDDGECSIWVEVVDNRTGYSVPLFFRSPYVAEAMADACEQAAQRLRAARASLPEPERAAR